MKEDKRAEIYFHVGLGKVASTYLQYDVFPKFKNIHYVQRSKYKRFREVEQKTGAARYLVSREFDRQFEEELRWFAEMYPHAHVIILFRRHDSWIASQYRRFVKNGFNGSFTDFIDLENDEGKWKKPDLYFYPKLVLIEELFENKPLVMFHDELKAGAKAFIDRIAAFIGASYNDHDISFHPRHKSYEEKQLKVFQKFSKVIFRKEKKPLKNRAIRFVRRIFHMFIRYSILYMAVLVPESWVRKEALIPQEELDKIRQYYQDDWERCLKYAGK